MKKFTIVICAIFTGFSEISAVSNNSENSTQTSPTIDSFLIALSNLFDKKIPVSLLTYTRNNSVQQIPLPLQNKSSIKTLFNDPEKKIVFIIHGFISDSNETGITNLAQAYLNRKDVVVFVVDWGVGAKTFWYHEAVANAKKVAITLINFIKDSMEHSNLKPSNIHLIGYSLGAHLAGLIGKEVPGIHRITGLDPASKRFEEDKESILLSKNDAQFVDVVHTNMIEGGYGLYGSIGHVDFYVNGGIIQPGCLVDIPGIGLRHWCSHYRVVELFIEAVRSTNCSFIGRKNFTDANENLSKEGNQLTVMGLETFEYPGRGDFYITTNSMSPFCQEQEQSSNETR